MFSFRNLFIDTSEIKSSILMVSKAQINVNFI